jgi:hypothetical protein
VARRTTVEGGNKSKSKAVGAECEIVILADRISIPGDDGERRRRAKTEAQGPGRRNKGNGMGSGMDTAKQPATRKKTRYK